MTITATLVSWQLTMKNFKGVSCKTTEPTLMKFILSIYMMVLQDLQKQVMI